MSNNPMYQQRPGSLTGQIPGTNPFSGQPQNAFAPEKEQEDVKGPPQTLEDLHIDELLHIVVDKNASDLHICTNSPPVIRMDGKLIRLNYEPFNAQDTQRMMFDILSDEHINRFETTLELDFSYALPRRARFRVNMSTETEVP
jgi:twitching motility protein PilT